jgi:hypothetical protein
LQDLGSNAKITSITGIKTQNLNLLYQKAISRGFDPSEDAKLLDIHVQDAAHSGQPKKQTDTIKEEVLFKVRTNRCYDPHRYDPNYETSITAKSEPYG